VKFKPLITAHVLGIIWRSRTAESWRVLCYERTSSMGHR